MPRVAITVAGRRVEFDIDDGRDDEPAGFLLSVRKSGSSIFTNMGRSLARANKRPFVDVAHPFFDADVPPRDYAVAPELVDLLRPGVTYGGFRNMPLAFLGHELFDAGPKILFVRDPRDAIVSEFFSMAWSHPLPGTDAGPGGVSSDIRRLREKARSEEIDAYALRQAAAMRMTIMQYEPVIGSPTLIVLKYEDYIFDKGALLRRIADHFGWRADDRLVDLILAWADVRPVHEDPTKFVRRVTPGDHLEKLLPATIAELNERLRPALELFGYTA